MRRGDNIPPVSDYAHWNEDAYYMWYEENKYDMMHPDEIIEEDDDYNYCDDCGMRNGKHDSNVEH